MTLVRLEHTRDVQAVSPWVEILLLSAMLHGRCDARPMVTFPACAGTKLILLCDRGTCQRPHPTAGWPEVEPETCRSPYHYATKPHSTYEEGLYLGSPPRPHLKGWGTALSSYFWYLTTNAYTVWPRTTKIGMVGLTHVQADLFQGVSISHKYVARLSAFLVLSLF